MGLRPYRLPLRGVTLRREVVPMGLRLLEGFPHGAE